MHKIKTILIDDEPLALEVLEEYSRKIPELALLQKFSNAIDANSFLAENEIDLIFLDINMPIIDGFSFLETLDHKPMVVITSAHEQYALKGFEADAIDYLVKPISFARFLKTTNRISRLLDLDKNPNKKQNDSIFVKIDNKRLQKIHLDEILIIESLKDYIHIKTTSDKYIVHKTLTSFTEELPQDKFIRIHRSYTVAIDKIDVVEGNSVEVAGVRYTIGRSYIDEAKQRILKL